MFIKIVSLPMWLFNFLLSASLPVVPDHTDFATPSYIGRNLSLGREIDPHGMYQFKYFLSTDKVPQIGDDYGLQDFAPNIREDLYTGPSIFTPSVSVKSGTVDDFAMIVADVPEPSRSSWCVSELLW